MSSPNPKQSWYQAFMNPVGWAVGALLLILTGVVVIESVLLYTEYRAKNAVTASATREESMAEKQSHTKTAPDQAGSATGTRLLMKNMRYCWTPKVCVAVEQLTALLQSEVKGQPVNFDAPDRFRVTVQQADALITPETLEGMFNESVFNYRGSKLKDLEVSITPPGKTDSKSKVHVSGQLNYMLWVPFGMDTNLSVDPKTNTIIIRVDDLKVLGAIPAKWILGIRAFEMAKLLPLPENKHLTIVGNEIRVKPFGLFPPPRLHGKLAAIAVTPRQIRIRFDGTAWTFNNIPEPAAGNYIYLQGGQTQFGLLGMRNTHIHIAALKPEKRMTFFISKYQHYLPLSQLKMLQNGGVLVKMPAHTP